MRLYTSAEVISALLARMPAPGGRRTQGDRVRVVAQDLNFSPRVIRESVRLGAVWGPLARSLGFVEVKRYMRLSEGPEAEEATESTALEDLAVSNEKLRKACNSLIRLTAWASEPPETETPKSPSPVLGWRTEFKRRLAEILMEIGDDLKGHGGPEEV